MYRTAVSWGLRGRVSSRLGTRCMETRTAFDTHVAQNGVVVLQSTMYMLAQGPRTQTKDGKVRRRGQRPQGVPRTRAALRGVRLLRSRDLMRNASLIDGDSGRNRSRCRRTIGKSARAVAGGERRQREDQTPGAALAMPARARESRLAPAACTRTATTHPTRPRVPSQPLPLGSRLLLYLAGVSSVLLAARELTGKLRIRTSGCWTRRQEQPLTYVPDTLGGLLALDSVSILRWRTLDSL